MSEWTRGPDLDQHPRRRHRRPGPRFQEPGAGPDQRPSRRHRQHLQAVDRRRRAHRDRARPVLGRLRQPEHGRRDQHHPEDRPHRARHLRRRQRRLVGLLDRARRRTAASTRASTGTSAPTAASATTTRLAAAAQRAATPPGRRYGGTGRSAGRSTTNNRVDFTVRTDGVYDAGFRGSSANIFAFDNRYNSRSTSPDNGKTPDERLSLFFQGYYVNDVDDLNNPSPLSTANAIAAHVRSTATGASSTSWARASSRASISGPATNCCSASTGSEAGSARRASAPAHQRDRAPALAARTTIRTRASTAFYARGCADAARRPADGARRRAPDLRHDDARSDALRAHADSGQQATTRRPPTRSARRTRRRMAQRPRRRLERLSRADRDRTRRQFHDGADRQRSTFGNPSLQPGNQPAGRGRRDRRMERRQLDAALFQNRIHQPHHERGSQFDQRGDDLRHHQQSRRHHAARD